MRSIAEQKWRQLLLLLRSSVDCINRELLPNAMANYASFAEGIGVSQGVRGGRLVVMATLTSG